MLKFDWVFALGVLGLGALAGWVKSDVHWHSEPALFDDHWPRRGCAQDNVDFLIIELVFDLDPSLDNFFVYFLFHFIDQVLVA